MSNIKIELNRSQEEFMQLYGKVINGKWMYFPNVFKKVGNYQYEEIEWKDLPEGIKNYIKTKMDAE